MTSRSIRLSIFALALAALGSGCATSAVTATGPAGSAGEGRFAAEIQSFEQMDSRNADPDRLVLFTGSSSVRMWKTAETLPGIPLINRGFGGSQFSDLNGYFDQIVAPHKPEVILVYEGDNDIASGKTSQDVLDGYMTFVGKVREILPETRIVFLSIKPSVSRWDMWATMAEANAWIMDVSNRDPLLFFADLATPLLNTEGAPDPSLFLGDGLHLNDKGYAIWSKHLAPVLTNARRVPLP